MLNPVTDTELDALYGLIAAKFPDNTSGVILPVDARQVLASMVEDSRKAKVRLDALTTNQVKGSVFRVPYVERVAGVPTVPTALIDPRFRILGMEALAENGVDAGEVAAGLRADPITFQLIAHSSGTVNALVNALPATTQTVKAHWVRTSGTDAEKILTYPVLVLEDHPYPKGDVVQYTFEDLVPPVARLFEWRAASVGFAHPVPTGEDDDPIYKPFAPLNGSAAYDDTALVARMVEVETDLDQAENDIVDLQNEKVDHDEFALAIGALIPLAGTAAGDEVTGIINLSPSGVLRWHDAAGDQYIEFDGSDNFRLRFFDASTNSLKGYLIFAPDSLTLSPAAPLRLIGPGGTGMAELTTNAAGELLVNGQPITDVDGQTYTAGTGIAISPANVISALGVAHKTGNAVEFNQDAEYEIITYSTFSVNTSTKRIGAVVCIYLGPGSSQPTLPNTEFQSKDIWVAGKNLMYMFKVGANGLIQYTITVLD